MGQMNVGKVRPVFKGDYSASTECKYYECWKYNGTWWLHIGTSPTTGTAPSEGTVWAAFGVKGDTGSQGAKGDPGDAGAPGTAAGFGTPTATASSLTAGTTPTVTVSASGDNTSKVFSFTFGIPKGDKGDTGDTGPKGDTGDTGPKGDTGTSITGAQINDDGELIITTDA